MLFSNDLKLNLNKKMDTFSDFLNQNWTNNNANQRLMCDITSSSIKQEPQNISHQLNPSGSGGGSILENRLFLSDNNRMDSHIGRNSMFQGRGGGGSGGVGSSSQISTTSSSIDLREMNNNIGTDQLMNRVSPIRLPGDTTITRSGLNPSSSIAAQMGMRPTSSQHQQQHDGRSLMHPYTSTMTTTCLEQPADSTTPPPSMQSSPSTSSTISGCGGGGGGSLTTDQDKKLANSIRGTDTYT